MAKLLHFVPQFSQIIHAALFAPPFLPSRNKNAKAGTKKPLAFKPRIY
jgi:hypothetical protein